MTGPVYSGWYPTTWWEGLGYKGRNKVRELRARIEEGHHEPCIRSLDDYFEQCQCGYWDAVCDLDELMKARTQ